MANPLQIFKDIEELGRAGQEAAQAPALYRDTLGVGRDIVKAKAPVADAPYIELPAELHELRPPAQLQPPVSAATPHSQTTAREFSSEMRQTPLDQDIARLMGELQDVPGAVRGDHVHNWMKQRFGEAWDHQAGDWHESVRNEMRDFHQSILDSFAVQQRARASMERARYKLAARPGAPNEPGTGDEFAMTPNEVRADASRENTANLAMAGLPIGGLAAYMLANRDKKGKRPITKPAAEPQPPADQAPTDWGAHPGQLWTPSAAPYDALRDFERQQRMAEYGEE